MTVFNVKIFHLSAPLTSCPLRLIWWIVASINAVPWRLDEVVVPASTLVHFTTYSCQFVPLRPVHLAAQSLDVVDANSRPDLSLLVVSWDHVDLLVLVFTLYVD